MTTDLATVALTFDGVDVQDLDGIFLEVSQGLFETGDTRGVDVTVPGLDGQVVRPRRFHQRKILLAGFVRGSGADQALRQTAYRTNLESLRDLFSETAIPADLVAVTEDGSTWTVAARCIPDGRVVEEQIKSEFSTVSIELLAIEDWDIEPAGS